MRKNAAIVLTSALVLCLIAMASYRWFEVTASYSYAMVNQKQVHLGIILHANENEGITPESLEALVPEPFDPDSWDFIAGADGRRVGAIEYLSPLVNIDTTADDILMLRRTLSNGDVVESRLVSGTVRIRH